MLKRWIAAAAAAVVVACAGSASAASIVEMTVSGDWDDWQAYRAWTFDVVFNTGLMSQSTTPDWYYPTVTTLSGTSDAVLSSSVTFIGWTFQGENGPRLLLPNFTTSIPTGISIEQTNNWFWISTSYGGGGNEFCTYAPVCGSAFQPFTLDHDVSIAANYWDANVNDVGAPFGSPVDSPAFLQTVNFKVLATVPEPATWAMMLMGFFGLGVALRGSRRASVRASA